MAALETSPAARRHCMSLGHHIHSSSFSTCSGSTPGRFCHIVPWYSCTKRMLSSVIAAFPRRCCKGRIQLEGWLALVKIRVKAVCCMCRRQRWQGRIGPLMLMMINPICGDYLSCLLVLRDTYRRYILQNSKPLAVTISKPRANSAQLFMISRDLCLP